MNRPFPQQDRSHDVHSLLAQIRMQHPQMEAPRATLKRPRDEHDASADMFIMEHIEEVLEGEEKRVDTKTLFYALHLNTFSHPLYNEGTPFTIDAYKEILSYLGVQAGGGKAMFKIAASLQSSRFGKPPNKRCATLLRKAGFTLVKKARQQ